MQIWPKSVNFIHQNVQCSHTANGIHNFWRNPPRKLNTKWCNFNRWNSTWFGMPSYLLPAAALGSSLCLHPSIPSSSTESASIHNCVAVFAAFSKTIARPIIYTELVIFNSKLTEKTKLEPNFTFFLRFHHPKRSWRKQKKFVTSFFYGARCVRVCVIVCHWHYFLWCRNHMIWIFNLVSVFD